MKSPRFDPGVETMKTTTKKLPQDAGEGQTQILFCWKCGRTEATGRKIWRLPDALTRRYRATCLWHMSAGQFVSVDREDPSKSPIQLFLDLVKETKSFETNIRGLQVTNLDQLMLLAHQKRSVFGNGWGPIPAAVVINMSGVLLRNRFEHGMWELKIIR